LEEERKMLPLKRILWPTDFSDASYAAVDAVKELASRFGAEVCAVHVVKPLTLFAALDAYPLASLREEIVTASKERLRRVVKNKLGNGPGVHAEVATGAPAHEIVRIADEEGIDLIVIATHGESGFHHLVFGSVTEKVIRLASCPVLVVRAQQADAKPW
jgi:universal stress protein A